MTIPGLLALFVSVFWPVSIWYFERLLDKSDEPLGVLSLIAFIAISFSRRTAGSASSGIAVPIASIVCTLIYAISYPFAPKLLSAVFAVMAIGFMLSGNSGRNKLDLGGWLLLLFSLPIVSSLNFYSGYPLRLVVGQMAAPLISMVGFPTVADGTTLIWAEHMVQIDAPCSGIKMLWFALFIGAVLASMLELKFTRSAIVLTSAVVAALAGNVLRITSLFFIETGIVSIDHSLDQFVHQAIGAIAFAISAGLTVLVALNLSQKSSAGAHEKNEEASRQSADGQVSNSLTFKSPRFVALIIVSLLAAIVPAVASRTGDTTISTQDFPGWPAQYDGAGYQPVPPSKADIAFYQEFPGKIQCVSQGQRRVIMRWVAKPTRQLHPSSDCFRGLGYQINWQPLVTDATGVRRSWFIAEKDGKRFSVKERIYDKGGKNWTDISSWYWSALLGKTKGPWWSDVEIVPI